MKEDTIFRYATTVNSSETVLLATNGTHDLVIPRISESHVAFK